jgi:hypothetical protein
VSIRGFFESSHGEVKVSGRIHLWLQNGTAASELAVHQNHLRPNRRNWYFALVIELQQTAPMIKPILAGDYKYSLIAAPKRLEPLLIQIEIAADTKISSCEFHLRIGIQPLNRMRKVEKQAGEIVRLEFADNLIIWTAQLLYRGRYTRGRKLIFNQKKATVAGEK